MNKNIISKKIEDRLSQSVTNLEKENFSEHDIFPSLLWLLLQNSKDIESLTKTSKDVLVEKISGLQESSTEKLKSIFTTEHQKSISLLIENSSEITKIENKLSEHINDLKSKLIEDLTTIIVQENKKNNRILKWLLGLCIIQFIVVGVFIIINMTR